MRTTFITYKCIKKFDPCYGYKIIKPGDTIKVRIEYSVGGIINHRITDCSNNDSFPGYGFPIYEGDLDNHFKSV